MTKTPATTPRYGDQRPRRIPPHVSLGDLRMAMGLTLDAVCERVEQESGIRPTRGAISAIENGHRGASVPLLNALEAAYGLREGSITTTYVPREREQVPA